MKTIITVQSEPALLFSKHAGTKEFTQDNRALIYLRKIKKLWTGCAGLGTLTVTITHEKCS